MRLKDVDRHLKYLVLTLLLLVALVSYHNVTLGEEDEFSFAMCDTTLKCEGPEFSGYCLGIEARTTSCVDPANASEYRRVEAECGLDAQAICNADPSLSGLEWTQDPNATYQGTRCEAWAEQDERIDLLRCEQTFNDVSQWSGTG